MNFLFTQQAKSKILRLGLSLHSEWHWQCYLEK